MKSTIIIQKPREKNILAMTVVLRRIERALSMPERTTKEFETIYARDL